MPKVRLNFGSPEKAKQFADHFGIVGIRATAVQEGRSVVVTTSDDKSVRFIKSMAEDIRGDGRADQYISVFLRMTKASAMSGDGVDLKLLDGSLVRMESAFAKRFLMLHEKLGDEARRNMCFITIQGKDSHSKAVDFVMGRD